MKNMKIKTKLFLGVGTFFAILIIVCLYATLSMQALASNARAIYEHPTASTNAILSVDRDIVAMSRSMKDIALAKNSDEVNQYVSAVDNLEKNVYKNIDVFRDTFLGDIAIIDNLQKTITSWKPIRDRVIQAQKNGNFEEAGLITKREGAPIGVVSENGK